MNRRILKTVVRDFFSFTRGERNGIIVLLFLILVTGFIQVYYSSVKKGIHNNDESIGEFKNQASLLNIADRKHTYKEYKVDTSNNDVEKEKYSKKKFIKTKRTIVELNRADSIELEKLPGIGPYTSRGIVKYREKLGGFYNVEQLLEVYNMKPENYNLCKEYISVDTLLIKKLDLNTATFKEINAHPYVSYEQTKAIFGFRNKGLSLNYEVISKNNLFDSVQIKKVSSYFRY